MPALRATKVAICLSFCAASGIAKDIAKGVATGAPTPPRSANAASKFYPGITEEQSLRAHDALRAFYNGNLTRAERLLRDLDAREDRDGLPPLSRLLHAAMTGLYLERDDAGDVAEAARLRADFDSAAAKGLRRCSERAARAGSDDPTCLLIEGGIRGFRAILRLNERAPLDVLEEGLGAVTLLERALDLDSSVRDAHMGLGIYHALASSSPRVARAALRAAGRGVSLDEGLAQLRRSGYEGQYTSVASQFFLIRFLSPYDDELRREKLEIFRSLRETFPLSAHTLFLQGHELLCFHPDTFYTRPRARVSLARRLRAIETRDYAARRYAALVKYQYSLLDPNPPGELRPDTTLDLGGYAFYPEFVEALHLRREITEDTVDAPDRKDKLKRLARLRKELMARVRKSGLNAPLRGLYEWQVRDALDPAVFGKR